MQEHRRSRSCSIAREDEEWAYSRVRISKAKRVAIL